MMADLLREIEAYLAQTGMGVTYFGKKAAGNSELVKRLRNGQPVEVPTADRVRAFMRANKPQDAGEPKRTATGT